MPDPTVTAAWIGVMGGLAGVIIGFGLTTGFEAWREHKKKKHLLRGLREELNSNRLWLPNKLSHIRPIWVAIFSLSDSIIDKRSPKRVTTKASSALREIAEAKTKPQTNKLIFMILENE